MPNTPGAMMKGKLFITHTQCPCGDLHERYWNGEKWLWVKHGHPQNLRIVSSPGAAMMDEKLFVVAHDGSLWERHWRSDLGRWVWQNHGKPNDAKATSSAGAAMANSKFFITASNGSLFERFWNGSVWVWIDHGITKSCQYRMDRLRKHFHEHEGANNHFDPTIY